MDDWTMKQAEDRIFFRNAEDEIFKIEDEREREIRLLLLRSLEAWEIMTECWARTLHLARELTDHDDLENLRHAVNHAQAAYGQEINGFRDHLKLILGEI